MPWHDFFSLIEKLRAITVDANFYKMKQLVRNANIPY